MLRHVNPILQGKEKVKTGEGPTDSLHSPQLQGINVLVDFHIQRPSPWH